MHADLVLYSGIIHTQDPARPLATALAAHEGQLVYVGEDAMARDLLAVGGEVIDLHGCCAIPGLVDAHVHLQSYARSLHIVDAETLSPQEALGRIAGRAQSTPVGEWVLGRGFNHNLWEGRFPTASQLDQVAPLHPVYVAAKSGHAAWVNSRALELAGIGVHTPDPAGGQIVRDAEGAPTGVMLEAAMELVRQHVPDSSLNSLVSEMREALANASRAGLTGLHDMDGPLSFRAQQVLHERGELELRILKSIPMAQLDAVIAVGLCTGYGDGMLRLGQVKMFADGALGQRTASMLDPYETTAHDTGIVATSPDVLRSAVEAANAAGLGCAIHAIGDRACREVLDVYESVRPVFPQCRNRIEHTQILHPDDVARVAHLGVIASMQPIHATSDMRISDEHLGDRAGRAYVFRSLLDSGAVVAMGSDCPVEAIDPLRGIHAAVTRRRADGSPGPTGWHAEQRLTVAEAVRGFTWGAAYAAGMEHTLGSLRAGYLADVTILDRDIYAIDPMEILNTKVVGTVVGGRFVWRDASL